MARLIRDSAHTTPEITMDESVYEIVFQTDEMYFHYGTFATEALAQQVADRGNSLLDKADDDIGLQIREMKLATAVHGVEAWTRQDFLDDIDGWDIEDYFLPEVDPDEAMPTAASVEAADPVTYSTLPDDIGAK